MLDILLDIQKLTEKQLKLESISDLTLSAIEELGEFARAYRIEHNIGGSAKKIDKLDEPCLNEAVDCVITAFAIYFAVGGTLNDFAELAKKKLIKWENSFRPTDS